MSKTVTAFAFAIIFLLAGFATAGEFAENLKKQLDTKSAEDTITVWIKLPSVENSKEFKSSVNRFSTSRIKRYHHALDRLKENHSLAQANLIEQLRNLEKSDIVTNIKPHWLINVVEADIKAGHLEQLVKRNDIDKIYAPPTIITIEPDINKASNSAVKPLAGVEPNLEYINAPQAWAAGYTGTGSVVCSFDTGVDGDHPALFNNWKGQDGDSAAAWYDPSQRLSFPHLISTNHGTHVMGIMVGHDDATGDTIGVALDAKWISAGVMDVPGASLIDGFEWAANPDGDPNTVDDIPDVINHSWGVTGIGCENVFYDLIDNTEALGIVNIFAAGNDGSDEYTITNPANRAIDSLDCFAVGNINHNYTPPEISSSSSRGPSDCNGATKPNVCAPGYMIISSVSSPNYDDKSGTSMAAPHVSGLVALLRQKNPNATVDEIKKAILTSTQTYTYSLPDNDFGWGVIDCMAALNALSSANADPNVRVYCFDHDPVDPGGTFEGTVVLQNLGDDAYNVEASLSPTNDALTIIDGSASFGLISESDTVRSADIIRVQVSDTASPGSIFSLDFIITGDSYTKTGKLYFTVGDILERSFVTHTAGNIQFTLSNFGTFGLANASFFPNGATGFTYDGGDNELYECGLMIGVSSNYVSDGVRNVIGEPDGDFKVIAGGNISINSPGVLAYEETSVKFTDERAESPLDIEITQNSYTYNTYSNNDFIILQYIIKNNNASMFNNLYIGLYFDWDVEPSSGYNSGGYDETTELAWMAYNNGSEKFNYRGIKVLQGTLASVYTQDWTKIAYPTYGDDGFTETEKFTALSDGFTTATTYANTVNDYNQTVSVVLNNFASGATDTIAFAILAGDDVSIASFEEAGDNAAIAYQGIVTDVEEDPNPILPKKFALHQNYPNPFNPQTTITFDLPKTSEYTLSVYNLLGQEVDRIEDRAKAGTVKIVWDGENFASGIYLYKITAGDFTDSRKMILLK